MELSSEFSIHLKPLLGVLGLTSVQGAHPSPFNVEYAKTISLILDLMQQLSKPVVWQDPALKDQQFTFTAIDPNHQVFKPRNFSSMSSLTSSPFSPLNPESSLYPNFLMSFNWIEKHRRNSPCAVLSFHYMAHSNAQANLNRDRDHILCQEINEKKRIFNDKAIKAVFIVLCDGQDSDDRIGFIRKTCSLDQKTLLPLVESDESSIMAFFSSLQKSLYDHAIYFYKEKSKKAMKKKRSRALSLANSTSKSGSLTVSSHHILPPPQSLGGVTFSSSEKRELNAASWDVRYNYKIAVFSEFRQDWQSALKYYEDSYQLLTALLRQQSDVLADEGRVFDPLSPQWTNAQMLLDHISYKMIKIYFYINEYTAAYKQFRRHLGFAHLIHLYKDSGSTVYGAVSWEWISINYKLFAELLEAGSSGSRIPFNKPLLDSLEQKQPSNGFTIDEAIDPGIILQSPGFYYRSSASCLEQLLQSAYSPEYKQAIVPKLTDLLTKSYESYKQLKFTRNTLFLASEIARIYKLVGDYEMAIKFFERIAKTYRKDGWYIILGQLLVWTAECAKQSEKWDIYVNCIFELFHLGFSSWSIEISCPKQLYLIDSQSIQSPIQVSAIINERNIHLGDSITVQICINLENARPELFEMPIKSIKLVIGGRELVVNNDSSLNSLGKVYKGTSLHHLGQFNQVLDYNLSFAEEKVKNMQFLIKPTRSQDLVIESVHVVLGDYFQVSSNPSLDTRVKWVYEEGNELKFKLMTGSGLNTVRVLNPSLDLSLSADLKAQILEDEMFEIPVQVQSTEPDLWFMCDVEAFDDQDKPIGEFFLGSESLGSVGQGSLKRLVTSEFIPYTAKLSGTSTVKLNITCYYSSVEFSRQVVATSPEIQRKVATWRIPMSPSFSVDLTTKNLDFSKIRVKLELKWKGDYPIQAHEIKLQDGILVKNWSIEQMQPNDIWSMVFETEKLAKIELGQLLINWKQGNSLNFTKIKLNPLEISQSPVSVYVDCKKQVQEYSPLPVKYTFYNSTGQVATIAVHVESSEGFVFAGLKSALIKILPFCSQELSYNIFPIARGHCVLPKLKVSLKKLGLDPNVPEKEEILKVSGVDSDQLTVFVHPTTISGF